MKSPAAIFVFLLITLVCSLRCAETAAAQNQEDDLLESQPVTPARLETPTAPPQFSDAFKQGVLGQYKQEYRIERSDLAVQAILHQTGTKTGADAVALGEAAVAFSPDTPLAHLFLADALWTKGDIAGAAGHYLTGTRLGWGDFAWKSAMLGSLGLLLLLALVLSMVTFALYSAVVFGRLFIHHLVEWSKGALHPVAAGFLLAAVLTLPALLGLSPFAYLIFVFLLFWGFYKRGEREIVVLFLIGVGVASWCLPYLTSLFVVRESPLLRLMVQNAQGDAPLVPPAIPDSDWRGVALSAAYEMQQGNYDAARGLYDTAHTEHPESSMVRQNMGNLSFYTRAYETAIKQYQEALEGAERRVAIDYNMSQAYREMLAFQEGETKYQEAVVLDAALAERYTAEAITYPFRPMIEGRFKDSDLWQSVRDNAQVKEVDKAIWQAWAGRVSLRGTPIVAGILIAVLLWLSSFLKTRCTASPCAVCSRPVCARCLERVLDEVVCHGCAAQFKSMGRHDEMAILKHGRNVQPKDYPLLVLPGLSQISKGKSRVGLMLMIAFYLLVGELSVGDDLFSGTQWHIKSSPVAPLFGLLLLYVVSTLYVMWRQITATVHAAVSDQKDNK